MYPIPSIASDAALEVPRIGLPSVSSENALCDTGHDSPAAVAALRPEVTSPASLGEAQSVYTVLRPASESASESGGDETSLPSRAVFARWRAAYQKRPIERTRVFFHEAYSLRGAPEVGAFLERHESLLDALTAGYRHVVQLLAPLRPPTLRLVVHSAEHDDRELLVEIPTSLSAKESLVALERFDETWWLDQPDEVRQRICFNLRFQ